MRGDAVGHQAFAHVVLVGQAQVFLGRDVAEHRRAEPADHGRTDRGRDVVVAGRDVGGQRAEGVERRFAAHGQLLVHVFLDQVHRHVAGALDHGLHVVLPGDLGQLAQGFELAELRGVVGVGDAARAQAVAQREADVVGLHDLADVFEVRVEEVFLVVGQAPLGHDRATAADDAGDALGGQRHVAQQHAGVDGEVVHALLGLFDQGVAEHFPGEVLGLAVDLFQRLVDRHGADRHRRVADDPLARLVDVLARAQVHHGVAAPADRPHQLLHFLGNAGGNGAVADVRVDLGEEVAADDHRLELGVVDVGRDDGAAARHFVAHEFRRDELLDVGAEGFAGVLPEQVRLGDGLDALVLADGDVFHLGRDDAAARVVHLGDVGAGVGAARRAQGREAHGVQRGVGGAAAAELRAQARQRRAVAALGDPALSQWRQARAQVNVRVRVAVRARGVVDHEGRVGLHDAEHARRLRQRDLAHRHLDVGARALDVDLARTRDRARHGFGEFLRLAQQFGGKRVHAVSSLVRPVIGRERSGGAGAQARAGTTKASLRRHYPDQVQRVCLSPLLPGHPRFLPRIEPRAGGGCEWPFWPRIYADERG